MSGLSVVKVLLPKAPSVSAKRHLLVDLYEALFLNLGREQFIPAVKAMILKAPESHIDLEWSTLENGTFQEVVATMIRYELDNEDQQHLFRLYQGVFAPYAQHQEEIPREDMEFAYEEILKFTRKIRRKGQLKPSITESEYKLLHKIAPALLPPKDQVEKDNEKVESSFAKKVTARYKLVAKQAKPAFGKDGKFQYAVQIDGLEDNGFFKKSFGQQLADLKKVDLFKAQAKQEHVAAKGKATLPAVKAWVKKNKPKQFYARWQEDSDNFKDDTVTLWVAF